MTSCVSLNSNIWSRHVASEKGRIRERYQTVASLCRISAAAESDDGSVPAMRCLELVRPIFRRSQRLQKKYGFLYHTEHH